MTILIIDTSSDRSFAAICKKEEILSQEFFEGKKVSKFLLPLISKWISSDIVAIAVGIGPGSFTGTRIGAAVAMSLAYGKKLPLISFDSTLAFSEELPAHLLTKFESAEFSSHLKLDLIYFPSLS